MASEIDVVEEVESRDQESASASTGGEEAAIGVEGFHSLRNDVCTAAGLGDLEKLRRLVECEGCSVSEPDGQGYYALQWAALSVGSGIGVGFDGGGEAAIGGEGVDSLRNDVYTAAGLGDLEKLRRLVECEGCSVSEPDGQGYYALKWAALSVRPAEAQYIIEVFDYFRLLFFSFTFG